MFPKARRCTRRSNSQGSESGVPQYAIHNFPTTVEAENYDHFTADGQGRTYNDLSSGNSGSAYRDGDVDVIAKRPTGEFALDRFGSKESGRLTHVTFPKRACIGLELALRFGKWWWSDWIDIQARSEFELRFCPNLPSTGGADMWETI